MKINDVVRITGLTQKAIRLYESKGLIKVGRDDNGYRNYSEADVELLKTVKLFRSLGTPISDIKLYLYGVVELDELVAKRRAEILKESGKNSEKYKICQAILESSTLSEIKSAFSFDEGEKMRSEALGALAVGIDIGTTNISAVVYDLDNGEEVDFYSLTHNSYVSSGIYSEQSVSVIIEKAQKLLYHILDTYEGIASIGITGQMHGIAYVNGEGEPISELITWQDKRGDEVLNGGKTVCDEILSLTGERISTGYGIATHYYNMKKSIVPRGAVGFLSIMDIFAMKICGTKKALTHASVGASFGLFDLEKCDFMYDKLKKLGIDASLLPSITVENEIVGYCREIPVSVPIGDNQASFLGSVYDNDDSMLVNVGTGSQISCASGYCDPSEGLELRPLIEGKYLIVGSTLCGGYAYSMLEEFFRSYANCLGANDESQYKILNMLAKEAYESGEAGLNVDVSFFGKRSDPLARGSIKMIGKENFTPADLTLGVLRGMVCELHALYALFPKKGTKIVASGGAVKRNEILRQLIEDTFAMPVSVSTLNEAAATGAALFSSLCIGKIEYENGFSKLEGRKKQA